MEGGVTTPKRSPKLEALTKYKHLVSSRARCHPCALWLQVCVFLLHEREVLECTLPRTAGSSLGTVATRLVISCAVHPHAHAATSLSHLVDEAKLREFDGKAVDETSGAGAKEPSPDQSGGTSGHVHDPGTGEVQDAAVKKEFRFPVVWVSIVRALNIFVRAMYVWQQALIRY